MNFSQLAIPIVLNGGSASNTVFNVIVKPMKKMKTVKTSFFFHPCIDALYSLAAWFIAQTQLAKHLNIFVIRYFCQVEKSLKIINLKDQQSDFSFWSKKSELERLSAIELLRQQYINYKNDARSRLQRVYRITNRKQG